MAALIAASLLAVACGGDDSGESSGDPVRLDEEVRSEVGNQLGGSSDTTGAGSTETTVALPETVEDLEAFWQAEREAVLAKIEQNGWGLDEATNTVKGPEGFVADLNACPSGWSNTGGLTDTEIKIGAHIAQSGTLADYGNMARAWQVYIDDVNENGGITDSEGKTRTIALTVKDDAYDPARAIPLVDELLDSEKTFFIWGGGSASIMRTYDKVNQRCVPHPFVWTGHPAWGDPVNHPWTTRSSSATSPRRSCGAPTSSAPCPRA